MRSSYDVIIIGGGHAGTEAAWAAANVLRLASLAQDRHSESRVALVTMDPSKIGEMSCNPAIGGLAKGQIVREIDALGGIMGLATDATGIQFRMLNTSKGAAVRGPRAQCDKDRYACAVQRIVASHSRIDVIAGTVDDIVVEDGAIVGVVLPAGHGVVQATIERDLDHSRAPTRPYPRASASPASASVMLRTRAVVLTTGTFMRALMHTGETKTPGGRIGEGSAVGISGCLARLGFELGRLKTGTPPRLARDSIDLAALTAQRGDAKPEPFSDLTERSAFPALPQVVCWETHTTKETHDLIRANLHRAPMYAGQIDAECGPRYCPSIEDKVVRFAERDAHHVFLEPETLHNDSIYCNGISTSLPGELQDQIVRAMPGCANARILRHGYAVEYDMVWPHQIDATGETKLVRGLYLAGQINGTSGYEEAGGQGLVAGLNAALARRELGAVRLGRDQAYIGVLMDDLVTRTPREPYRMFTSRAEHRLLLRADNADERLTPLAIELGLADARRAQAFEARCDALQRARAELVRRRRDGRSLAELALRPEIDSATIAGWLDNSFDATLIDRVVTDLRYAGYVARQSIEIKRQRELEHASIPGELDPSSINGLRTEAVAVLQRFRPATMGQASRLAGITPGDMTLIALAVRRLRPRELTFARCPLLGCSAVPRATDARPDILSAVYRSITAGKSRTPTRVVCLASDDLARTLRSGLKRVDLDGDALIGFNGENGETRAPAPRVVVLGLGKRESITQHSIRLAAARLVRTLERLKASAVLIDIGDDQLPKSADRALLGRAFGEGLEIANWRVTQFDGTASNRKSAEGALAVDATDRDLRTGIAAGLAIATSVNYARQLGATPPNICTPAWIASEARKLASKQRLKQRVISYAQAKQLGMGGLVNVGRGSAAKPCLVVLEWKPTSTTRAARDVHLVLVGKTLTYDTGGYSLKVNNGMKGMKYDKCGGTAVLGAMRAIAAARLPVRVTALLPAAENMVSSDSYRPDDIITQVNGVTVEVTNTDAEGRLVLADALAYACKTMRPSHIVDIATLTGGIVTALGSWCAGLMCNDADLRGRVERAGDASGDRVWHMPLWTEHREHMRSQHADIVNSNPSRLGHPLQGGAFLSFFVDDKIPWAHVDIAGTATTESTSDVFSVQGPTGFGVRLMYELAAAFA